MATIDQEASGGGLKNVLQFIQLEIPGYILDGDANTPSEIIRVYNSYDDSMLNGEIEFLDVTWSPLPFTSEGWAITGDGSNPTVRITVPDKDAVFLSRALQYDDLLGCIVTKWESTLNLIGSGSYYGPEIWFISRILEMDGVTLTIECSMPTDLRNRQIPGKRCFREQFPALGRTRGL